MPTANIKAKVETPESVTISLVRKDELRTRSIFRIFFDVYLAVASALVGVLISSPSRTT
ncbi:MAG: hypothetical protein JXR25_03390 [Pontiellaceae bacterium]|nr:hypothetical protein [Pontiellaceae bacterium]MBN2783847.1 hypothetical protein [Pontiellaceae bacterium]